MCHLFTFEHLSLWGSLDGVLCPVILIEMFIFHSSFMRNTSYLTANKKWVWQWQSTWPCTYIRNCTFKEQSWGKSYFHFKFKVLLHRDISIRLECFLLQGFTYFTLIAIHLKDHKSACETGCIVIVRPDHNAKLTVCICSCNVYFPNVPIMIITSNHIINSPTSHCVHLCVVVVWLYCVGLYILYVSFTL